MNKVIDIASFETFLESELKELDKLKSKLLTDQELKDNIKNNVPNAVKAFYENLYSEGFIAGQGEVIKKIKEILDKNK